MYTTIDLYIWIFKEGVLSSTFIAIFDPNKFFLTGCITEGMVWIIMQLANNKESFQAAKIII